MTQTRFGSVVPVLILLLFVLSCGRFTSAPKPTQVVDLPSMFGKSLTEMTAILGPSTNRGICHGWTLPEGILSVCYESENSAKETMSSISYDLIQHLAFAPRSGIGSPEEMAPLVNIDLQGRKPDVEFMGGYSYDLILNGKAVYVAFDGGPKEIVGVRVHPR